MLKAIAKFLGWYTEPKKPVQEVTPPINYWFDESDSDHQKVLNSLAKKLKYQPSVVMKMDNPKAKRIRKRRNPSLSGLNAFLDFADPIFAEKLVKLEVGETVKVGSDHGMWYTRKERAKGKAYKGRYSHRIQSYMDEFRDLTGKDFITRIDMIKKELYIERIM